MANSVRILCIGDVVRKPGCDFLMKKLAEYKRENSIDFCIVNGENSAVGDGMLKNSCEDIFCAGADVITGGDHSLRRREFYGYIDSNDMVIRPLNTAKDAPGKGYVLADKGAFKVGVINLLGNVWTDSFSNPFLEVKKAVDDLRKETNIIIVDMHAEATSEKKAMGYYLDGEVSAVFGTHTHVQTSDATILEKGTGYITDVGMTGPEDSVLGIKKETVLKKFTNGFTDKFEAADTPCFMQGCRLTIDKHSGKCLEIQAVTVR